MNVTVQAPGAIRLFVQSPGFYSLPRTKSRLPAIHEIQPNDSWVTVHSLKTSDGGLLDPDDRLNDVADDREQIVAVYEERDSRGGGQHGSGDGTSASSDGTRSPVQNGDHKFQPFSRVDIEVTGEQDHTCSLQVRRGSEPALNQICPLPQFPPAASRADASKRWSAAPIIDDDAQAGSTLLKTASCDPLTPPGERGEPSGDDRERLTLPRLARDSNRLSMQILGNSDAMWRWADAADRALSARDQRWEPVGGAAASPGVSDDDATAEEEPAAPQLIVLSDVSSPLGIHVVPESDPDGREGGVVVQRVDAGGAVARDGRIRVGDRISQINGHHLAGCSLQRAQELFTAALSQGELRLSVTRARPGSGRRPPLPVYPGSRSGSQTPVDGISAEEKAGSRVATVTPTKKVPASLSSRTQNVMLTSNTRKLGRRLTVALVKGAAGLGFSVTTRDNPAGGHAPVYVKTILPKGAAVEDGRLRPGDRLLEIDGTPVTGLSQQQVVQALRAVPPGHAVQLVLSRHEQPDDKKPDEASPKLPRPLTKTTPSPDRTTQTKPPDAEHEEAAAVADKEVLVFDIPVHDSERAGLGVSVKGKTTPGKDGPVDVGIYIKSVIHGGAASKDSRLQHNDQLIDINNNALLGLSNGQAMETLRRAMCQEGPKPGVITLTVARRRDSALSNGRESASSLVSNSSGEVLSGRAGPDAGASAADSSEVTITHRRAPPPPPPLPAEPAPPVGRNPVIDRLTGRNNMRNDSYYMATHDSWPGGAEPSQPQPQPQPQPQQQRRLAAPTDNERPAPALCPTVNMPSGDTVVIESDPPPASLSSQQSDANTDVAYASQTSLEQAGVGFTRDQLGRQSISEKRHASKDAKSTDTYQRTKRAREEREHQRRVLEAELKLEEARARRPPDDVGPSLGMKKSSSLESLQTMVHELALAEDGERTYAHRGPVKVVRGRGCNESFRAAVDRSYEAPLGDDADNAMETLDEEAAGADAGDPLFSRDRTARQSSLSSGAVEGKKNKRRSGLLKGLGSMFRFGRHRKSSDVCPAPRLTADELRQQQEELNRVAARRRAEDEQRRIQQQYQRLVQQQQQQQQTHRPGAQPAPAPPPPPPPPERTASSRPERVQQLREQHQRRHVSRQGLYRTEAAEERADLQLREADELKPQPPPPPPPAVHLADRLNNNVAEPAPFWRAAPFARGARSSEYFRNHRPAPLSAERAALWRAEEGGPAGGWRGSPDPYDSMRRPGSRTALAEPAPPGPRYVHHAGREDAFYGPRPKRWSGQVLLEQLEAQFKQDASRQHQVYHSQRSGRAEPRPGDRPMGSFYEYESVQAMMRLGGGAGAGEQYSNRSLPRHHERARPVPVYPRPIHGLKHAISAGPGGARRPQHLGIPAPPLAPPYVLRGPHRPAALSPPGSRV